MKKLIIALALAALPCHAATDHPDGSTTLTKEESAALLEHFQQMEAKIRQQDIDQERAIQVFRRMQAEIDRLEKQLKEVKCF